MTPSGRRPASTGALGERRAALQSRGADGTLVEPVERPVIGLTGARLPADGRDPRARSRQGEGIGRTRYCMPGGAHTLGPRPNGRCSLICGYWVEDRSVKPPIARKELQTDQASPLGFQAQY